MEIEQGCNWQPKEELPEPAEVIERPLPEKTAATNRKIGSFTFGRWRSELSPQKKPHNVLGPLEAYRLKKHYPDGSGNIQTSGAPVITQKTLDTFAAFGLIYPVEPKPKSGTLQ